MPDKKQEVIETLRHLDFYQKFGPPGEFETLNDDGTLDVDVPPGRIYEPPLRPGVIFGRIRVGENATMDGRRGGVIRHTEDIQPENGSTLCNCHLIRHHKSGVQQFHLGSIKSACIT